MELVNAENHMKEVIMLRNGRAVITFPERGKSVTA